MSNNDWNHKLGPHHKLYRYVGGPKCGAQCALPPDIPEWGDWVEVYDSIPPGSFVDFPEGGAIHFTYRIEPGVLVLTSEKLVVPPF